MENTSDPSCPEGLVRSVYYDFYQVYRADIFVPIETGSGDYDFELI